MTPLTEPWWAPRDVPTDHTLICRLGPLTLEIHHAPGEWRIRQTHDDDEAAAPPEAELAVRPGGLDEEDSDRYMVAGPDGRLTLAPCLLDRPVVIRPRQPVFLPQGESTTLYMSTPVMVSIRVGEDQRLLRELASLPLSDTWFGSTTRDGELCYSGRTRARHRRADLPRRAHRAVTPVQIRNEADAPLPLDRLSLPVQVLSVFGSADGSLWTESLSLIRDRASDLASLEVEEGAPAFAGAAELLAGPREPRASGGLVRAFSVLFGEGA